jgi:hypothetical protein
MNPIGQTFYVSEPSTGVPGVYITQIDVFFQSVSPTYGIEMQIRTTLNGVPTQERLPFASKILYPASITNIPNIFLQNSTNVPYASSDASVATSFVFDTPVFVQSGLSYAIVLLPLGGNPDYTIWTAEIGGTDTVTNSPIYTNNDTGDLFLSSNDKDWTPIITEDMKFTIYIANFTSLSGTAVFRTPDEDYVELYDINGSFALGEPLYPTNEAMNIAVLNVTGVLGSFNNGDHVYQSNGSSNTATGVVYSSNSSVIKLSNTTGGFSSTYYTTLYNSASVSNAVVTVVSQNASITTSSNTFSVPDSSVFSNGDFIYISTNTGSKTRIFQVTAIPDTKTVAFSNVFISSLATSDFTDTNCIYGKVLYNGTLHGGLGSLKVFPDFTRIILDNVSSTTSNNFNAAIGNKLVGLFSGASATVNDIINVRYNQISPNITNIAPANTGISWQFTGVKNDPSFTRDPAGINISEGLSNEQYDYERVVLSRSNELSAMPVGRTGERTVQISASFNSSNNKISPVIDTLSKVSNFSLNLCSERYDIEGYYLNVANSSGSFSNGDIITQGSASGTVRFANSSFIRVTDLEGAIFQANSTPLTDPISGANAIITTAEFYSEVHNNGLFSSSRYISKTVSLAQTSEDIAVYIGAWRPAPSNIIMYIRAKNNQDSTDFNNVVYSRMVETSSPSLISSSGNPSDLVELTYGFPQSINLYTNGVVCNTSSNVVNLFTTSGLNSGQIVYFSDSDQSKFNVRVISSVVNSSAITLTNNTSFSSTNSAFGRIPNLQSVSGVFLNDQNNNIARYVTNNDLVFDGFDQFSVKIVPVSDTTALVPHVTDLRVIAMQV